MPPWYVDKTVGIQKFANDRSLSDHEIDLISRWVGLHQDRRLASAAPSRDALQAAIDAGAWCSWLSGSGPTVAAMCPFDDADELAAHMPADGHTKVLRIDHGGAVIEADD